MIISVSIECLAARILIVDDDPDITLTFKVVVYQRYRGGNPILIPHSGQNSSIPSSFCPQLWQ
jgi:hypothetical protein